MKTWMLALAVLLAACLPAPTPSLAGSGAIEVSVVAGPVCPVEQDPPDPNCQPRAVEGARILVQPGDGREVVVAEATTDAAGRVTLRVAPGDYIVVGAEVEGLMGRPEPFAVTVRDGASVDVVLAYDTGIR